MKYCDLHVPTPTSSQQTNLIKSNQVKKGVIALKRAFDTKAACVLIFSISHLADVRSYSPSCVDPRTFSAKKMRTVRTAAAARYNTMSIVLLKIQLYSEKCQLLVCFSSQLFTMTGTYVTTFSYSATAQHSFETRYRHRLV